MELPSKRKKRGAPSPEYLLAKYSALASRELMFGQMRFQAMGFFLAATLLIATHVSAQRHGIAVLLAALSVGMLIIDLKNRASAWKARDSRQDIESETERAKKPVKEDRFRLVTHTTVFDFVYGGVFGYAISLLLPTWGWHHTWPIAAVSVGLCGVLLVTGTHLSRNWLKRNYGS